MLNHQAVGAAESPEAAIVLRAVLVVEDDGLLSMMMEDLVREHGATAVHVCREAAAALRVVEQARLDCAVLDVSLHGTAAYEVADALAARGTPFMFCTGLTAADIDERHRHRPLLAKPYGDADFTACLATMLAR
jgi:CheY-like chemotaxis protein